MGSTVVFANGLIEQIVARARASRDEVCGLLLGTPDRVSDLRHCANMAPDPASAFEIDPGGLIAAFRAARAGGPRVTGCYHSHPSGRAAPSARDARDAAANGWLWLIVGERRVRVYRAVENGVVLGRFEKLDYSEGA